MRWAALLLVACSDGSTADNSCHSEECPMAEGEGALCCGTPPWADAGAESECWHRADGQDFRTDEAYDLYCELGPLEEGGGCGGHIRCNDGSCSESCTSCDSGCCSGHEGCL